MNEKTTVYLDALEHRRLKELAASENRPTAELIREAVAEYVARRSARPQPKSIGAFRSGQPDLARRDEEYLEGFGN